jgi:hypothetical protein
VPHLEVGGRIILKWLLDKYDAVLWTGFIFSGEGPVEGSCEHGKKSSAPVKVLEILE